MRRKKPHKRRALYIEEKEQEETFCEEAFDDADPYEARLPSLVLEMRKEHEEVVPPKGWIPFVLLMFVPAAGAVILFLTTKGKGIAAGKNIRNFALPSAWISTAYTAALAAGVWILYTYGHQMRMWVMGLIGG